MATFGERLKKLRKERNITTERMADITNVTKGTVSLWESDRRFPRKDKFVQLCEYFNVSYDYLMGTSPYRSREEQEFWQEFNDDSPTEEQEAESLEKERLGNYYDYIRKYEVLTDQHKEAVLELIDVYFEKDK